MLLVLVYSTAIAIALQPFIDPDIWWHVRTGQWIVEHRAVPFTDPFSTYGEGKAWIEYSWLFDLAVYGLYELAGLRGMAVYRFAFGLAIILALQRLVMLAEPRPARAAALTAVAFLAMAPTLTPRSYLFSILCFIVVLHTVLVARRSRRAWGLFLLAPVFLVWANVHIQFVYGLAVLGLATVDRALDRWWAQPEATGPSLRMWLLGDAACVLATLITPYHFRLYAVLHDVAAQTGVYWFNLEMRAPQFRQLADWAALGLVLGAAFMAGRREVPRFILWLSGLAVIVSFRSGRDIWFAIVCALLVISVTPSLQGADGPRPQSRVHLRAAAVVTVLFLLLLTAQSASGLQARVAREFPVGAAQAVERGGYRGSLYNHFNWGGYLIWRLPALRVSMDGRSHIHGDARIVRSILTWRGLDGWSADPELQAASIVIADVDMPLASLLRRDDRFREVYADDRARVFVARRSSGARSP